METLDSRELQEELEGPEEPEAREQSEAAKARHSALKSLAEELDGFGWHDGIQLIPVADFTEYARDLAYDMGAVPSGLETPSWPNYCIDWEYAARELAHDYSVVTFEEAAYYWREV